MIDELGFEDSDFADYDELYAMDEKMEGEQVASIPHEGDIRGSELLQLARP